ncbi:MAG: 6-carboxytetrahydropterin synthase [Bacteroidia bacterium]|nr:6-carboxytetrahydropterin synthase [Bacteroidia bacterium]
MSVIRVTREFHFEMAHALWNYDGDCRYIHGHSYRLFVTVSGRPNTGDDNPKAGMVIDFGDLKKIVHENIISQFDHSLAINSLAINDNTSPYKQMPDKLVVLNFQPTCENLVTDFALRIAEKLPGHLVLFSVRLQETATSWAEWFASDNS